MMPSKILSALKKDDFWSKPCVHSGEFGVEAEHALFYGRKAIQEVWAIVPVAMRFNRNPTAAVKEKSAYHAMLQCKEAGRWEETKAEYPKKDWDKEFELLNEKYSK